MADRPGAARWTPNIEVRDFDIPDAGVYRGHEGFRDWLSNWARKLGRNGGLMTASFVQRPMTR